MIPLQQAQELVKQQRRSFGKEQVPLDDAINRVLLQSIIADRNYPPFNRATMDGIAVRSKDYENGLRVFKLTETIFAGGAACLQLKEGECYKIMTGAAIPASADAVIRKEDVEAHEKNISVNVSAVKAGQNIAAEGSDIKKGSVIVGQPQLIKPGIITMLASLGYAVVQVEKKPSVSIITTGDEVVAVDAPVNEVQIRNSNAHLLKALLGEWKIKPAGCVHVNDDAAILAAAIERSMNNDILILSGAVSAGEADFVPEVLTKLGAKKIFHQVAIRPGKPVWLGAFENGPVVFALPGNPFSTFVTFKLFIEYFLRSCFNLPVTKEVYLPFNGERIKKTNLDEFFPVAINGNPSTASAIPFNTSGDITAVMQADALALQPIEQSVLTGGTMVSCLLL